MRFFGLLLKLGLKLHNFKSQFQLEQKYRKLLPRKKCMNKRFKYVILPALALTLLGGGAVAEAHGLWGGFKSHLSPQEQATRQSEMFQEKANMLGVSADEIKNAWAQGKGLLDLAKEKGITEEQLKAKMQEARKQQIQEHLKVLVGQGVITQAQADQRLQFMESMAQKKPDQRFKGGMKSW